MNISKFLMKSLVILSCVAGAVFPADAPEGAVQPQLSVVESPFVSFTSSAIEAAGGNLTFSGSFLVSGNAVFGHFDLVVFDDSGKVVQIAKSTDQAYKKDHGPKPRPIALDIGMATGVAKVEVSFHEMRVSPEAGACVSK